MTSNLGSDIILRETTITPAVRSAVDALLHKTFRPEFLNRIDSIVFFRKLSEEDVQKIAYIHIGELTQRLQEKQIQLSVDDAVVAHVAREGYAPEFGARPLKRVVQQQIIVPISRYLLVHAGVKTVKVSMRNDQVVVE